MIVLKSEWSPQAAQELQEADNAKMLEMLLRFGGLTEEETNSFVADSALAVDMFHAELGEPDADGNHTDEQWDAAKAAMEAPLAMQSAMLAAKGITIENILVKSEDKNMFSWINTTIYAGFDNQEPVAQIQRPVPDIEAETYIDNRSGFSEEFPDNTSKQSASERLH